jgi:hypothetical protein
MAVQSRLEEARQKAREARAHAVRCAESADRETDDAMKSYLRRMAVSWTQIAEDAEFLLEIDGRHPS